MLSFRKDLRKLRTVTAMMCIAITIGQGGAKTLWIEILAGSGRE